jgi:ring-1,2-phenylacetyl-CoA epoxidase subunit PaaC
MSNLWTAPDTAGLLKEDASRDAVRSYLLAAADDELIIGHRHSEWTGFAPDIESDVALSSVAQDELGHARVLYEQVAAVDGTTPRQMRSRLVAHPRRSATPCWWSEKTATGHTLL